MENIVQQSCFNFPNRNSLVSCTIFSQHFGPVSCAICSQHSYFGTYPFKEGGGRVLAVKVFTSNMMYTVFGVTLSVNCFTW